MKCEIRHENWNSDVACSEIVAEIEPAGSQPPIRRASAPQFDGVPVEVLNGDAAAEVDHVDGLAEALVVYVGMAIPPDRWVGVDLLDRNVI